tara:strand:- start:284 stop:967 length:684 start_codon:yes stop_codon:yes gene_type:complete
VTRTKEDFDQEKYNWERILAKRKKWRTKQRKRLGTEPKNYTYVEQEPRHIAKQIEKARTAKFYKENPEALEIKDKECRICKETKPITEYYLRPNTKTFRSECGPCLSKLADGERKVVGSSRHCGILLRDARNRAKEKGISFTLTIKDIQELTTDTCPVLGFEFIIGVDSWENSPTLDRIDNNKGYEKDNVIMVSHLVNTIKNKATPSQLSKVTSFYTKLYKEKGMEV